jgi:hypothetical protein
MAINDDMTTYTTPDEDMAKINTLAVAIHAAIDQQIEQNGPLSIGVVTICLAAVLGRMIREQGSVDLLGNCQKLLVDTVNDIPPFGDTRH